MRNTKLGASTEVANQDNFADTGYIASQKHDQTAGNHKTWLKDGTLQTDSTIFRTASPSMRMTPRPGSQCESAYQFNGIQVPVANGQTVTINVWMRKSTAGDGEEFSEGDQSPQLIVKANPAVGITADAVLDTMTVGSGTWEQLTGTTAAVTDDGVLEFVVDADADAGWVNVDDWSTT